MLLMLLACAGWFRSAHKQYDIFGFAIARLHGALLSSESRMLLAWRLEDEPAEHWVEFRHRPGVPIGLYLWMNIVGDNAPDYEMQWGKLTFLSMRGVRVVVAPAWMIALGAAMPLAVALGRWSLARRRVITGHCQQCGYDLRATPDRCPECGTIPSR
jgi:hypothetical protein